MRWDSRWLGETHPWKYFRHVISRIKLGRNFLPAPVSTGWESYKASDRTLVLSPVIRRQGGAAIIWENCCSNTNKLSCVDALLIPSTIYKVHCISVWGIFIFTFLGLGRGETASGLVTELVNNAGSMCQITESSNKSQWLETKKSISLSCSRPHTTHNWNLILISSLCLINGGHHGRY